MPPDFTRLRVAIVGAGPSGFYAAAQLLAVQEPQFSVHVFDRLPEAPVAPPDARGYALVLRSDAPSPWTNENTNVTYFPAVGTLHRHGEWIRAPASLARKIDHDMGVVPPGAGSDGAPFPWGPIGAAAGAGLIATLVAALSFRRRKPARAS